MMTDQDTGDNKVTILGARGSIPVSGREYAVYGGATACVLLETEGSAILFDAGSGILQVPQYILDRYSQIHIFLSHFHLDHLLGLTMSRILFDKEKEVFFYTADEQMGCMYILHELMHRPLWPVGPEVFRAKLSFRQIGPEAYQMPDGRMSVRRMPVSHPGGAYAYRMDWQGRSMVYATDCELDEDGSRQMQSFAADTDLLILDAQYTAEEYRMHKGFGHTSIEAAAAAVQGSRAAGGLLFHHAPGRTDAQLLELGQRLLSEYPQIRFARERDIIRL